nr:hypothetical protein B0A51_15776 [Rachicladosporium sp. CCFEE 5018]
MAAPNTSTSDLYRQWAATYDTDGNILQAVDDLQLANLLPSFVQNLRSSRPDGRLRVLDLGCGTGRNTKRLLLAPSFMPLEVTGIDASEAMLAVALEKFPEATYHCLDPFSRSSPLPNDLRGSFDGLISTLVLEHLPSDVYFSTLVSLLVPGGRALVTNMHPDMGSRTGAGFKLGGDGERVRGVSFAHGVRETIKAAQDAGLEILEAAREVEVDEEMIQRWKGKELERTAQRAQKWIGVKVWYGVTVRKIGDRED